MCEAGTVVGVTCAILVLLFAGQRYGSSKVGFTFAPIVIVWFTANVMINLYNIIVYYPGKPFPPTMPEGIKKFCTCHGCSTFHCGSNTKTVLWMCVIPYL